MSEDLKERALQAFDTALPDGVASRFPVGRGSALTPEEQDDIRLKYLIEHLTIAELARRTGRGRETISKLLADDETKALRAEIKKWKREAAKVKLEQSVDVAANAWTDSLTIASKKGDHRPARDLLLAESIISPSNQLGGGQVIVNVGIIGAADVVIGGVPMGVAPEVDEPRLGVIADGPVIEAREARRQERAEERAARTEGLWRGSRPDEPDD